MAKKASKKKASKKKASKKKASKKKDVDKSGETVDKSPRPVSSGLKKFDKFKK